MEEGGGGGGRGRGGSGAEDAKAADGLMTASSKTGMKASAMALVGSEGSKHGSRCVHELPSSDDAVTTASPVALARQQHEISPNKTREEQHIKTRERCITHIMKREHGAASMFQTKTWEQDSISHSIYCKKHNDTSHDKMREHGVACAHSQGSESIQGKPVLFAPNGFSPNSHSPLKGKGFFLEHFPQEAAAAKGLSLTPSPPRPHH
jgi:hypothetical protein